MRLREGAVKETTQQRRAAAAACRLPAPHIPPSPRNTHVHQHTQTHTNAQCPGGMFDCEGDRREYARQQWQDFKEAGGVPKRKRDPDAQGARSR